MFDLSGDERFMQFCQYVEAEMYLVRAISDQVRIQDSKYHTERDWTEYDRLMGLLERLNPEMADKYKIDKNFGF